MLDVRRNSIKKIDRKQITSLSLSVSLSPNSWLRSWIKQLLYRNLWNSFNKMYFPLKRGNKFWKFCLKQNKRFFKAISFNGLVWNKYTSICWFVGECGSRTSRKRRSLGRCMERVMRKEIGQMGRTLDGTPIQVVLTGREVN